MHRSRRILTAVACATARFHCAPRAAADSFTWIWPVPGEWFNPMHWQGGAGVPDDATDDAFVDAGAMRSSLVEVNGDLTLNALTVSPNDAIRLLDARAFRANAVQVDSGTFSALNQTTLSD